MTDVKRSWFKEYETQAKEIAELKELNARLSTWKEEAANKFKADAIREMLKHIPQPRYWHNYEVIKVINEYADKLEGKGE